MPRRNLTTDAWIDDRFLALTATAKLAFIRVVTGPEIGPAGAIRLTTSRASKLAADIPAEGDEWADAWAELEVAELVRSYPDEWWLVPAWMRHQVSGIGMIRAAQREVKTTPEALGKWIDRELKRLFTVSQAASPQDNTSENTDSSDPDRTQTWKRTNSRGNRQPDVSLQSASRQPDVRHQGGTSSKKPVEPPPGVTGFTHTHAENSTPPAPLRGEADGSSETHDASEDDETRRTRQELEHIDLVPAEQLEPEELAAVGGIVTETVERLRLAAIEKTHRAKRVDSPEPEGNEP